MKKTIVLFLIAAMLSLQAMALALSTTAFDENNYIEAWGRLQLVSTANSGDRKVQLADENGQAVQLRGWSTHGYQWSSAYFGKKSDFESMKRLGANVVRLTCYVSKDEINLTAWNNTKIWVKNAITWCAEIGLYAIVDYHVLTPGNPNNYLNDAGRENADVFFLDISAYVKENGYYHVIYEICNEPNGTGATWAAIKNYAAAVLPVIAENDPEAVVIVGTPQWSQKLTDVRSNPVIHETLQIMYAFHFYACTHKVNLLNAYLTEAVLRTIPVFATEWNDTEASGRGSCGTPPSSHATAFLNRCNNDATQRVSWTSWCWSRISGNAQEPASYAWKKETPTDGTGYTAENLTPTGLMVYNELQQNHINYGTDSSSRVTTTENSPFSLYPAPSGNGSFCVRSGSSENALLSVQDLHGRNVYSATVENGFATVDAGLKPGVYVVSVQTATNVHTQKLIIK